MPKSRKQRTGVKGKRKPGTRSRRINEDVPVIPLLESTVELAGELEMQQIDSGVENSGIRTDDYADVSEERSSIISIVKGLEEQVDTAFKLKEVLEAELDAVQKKLSEESAARAQLESQVRSLETQAALAGQLREDITFAEEERNKYANLLAETQPQLEAVTGERDSLVEEVTSARVHAKELEGEKMAFEAQVMNLKDKVADIDRLRTELGEVTEDLRAKLTGADRRVANLRAQLEEQQAVNRELVETRTRLKSEIKMLNANHKTVRNELEEFKKALRDIRSEATRTSGRVRQRYFKLKDKR